MPARHHRRVARMIGCVCSEELKEMAPQVGLEPTTLRLTAGCSAIELLRSGSTLDYALELPTKSYQRALRIGNSRCRFVSSRLNCILHSLARIIRGNRSANLTSAVSSPTECTCL